MRSFLYFVIVCLLFSCGDKEVGENGVVENAITGERIPNVQVILTSEQGNQRKRTDSIGYFSNIISFGCGWVNCEDDYRLTFRKTGFETEVINDGYFNSSEATFVTEGTKDTLIIKMQPN